MILEKIDKYNLLIQGYEVRTALEPRDVLRSVRREIPESEIQLLRADHIAGKEHLTFAARSAVRAFRQRREHSRSLAIEFLLYASCQRQISRAIERLGVNPQTPGIVLAVFTTSDDVGYLSEKVAKILNADLSDDVLEIRTAKKVAALMKAYDITRLEIEAVRLTEETDSSALQRIIIERGALLTVRK